MNAINAYLQKLERNARGETPRARTPWLLLGGAIATLIYLTVDPKPAAGIPLIVMPAVLLISFGALCLTAILRLLTRP